MELKQLTPTEKQELAFTKKRVMYNNNWHKSPWYELAQKQFMDRLKALQKTQIFESVKLHIDNATTVLFNDAYLNKLHSIITDIYDDLPLYPDAAFDKAWSALEIAMNLYRKRILDGGYTETDKMMEVICKQELASLFKDNQELKSSLFKLFDIMPLSVARFAFARLFHHREIEIQSHYGKIKQRIQSLLGDQVYNGLCTKYQLTDDQGQNAKLHYASAQEIRDIFKGAPIHTTEKTYEKLEEYKRLWFMMSGVLYTARNERFHGDNFSHFKSSLSSIKTYGHFYYLLLFTYSLLWTVMLRLSLKSGYPDFVTANQVQTSIDRNIELYLISATL